MQKNMKAKDYILLPCAGASNVGRLTLAASHEFTEEKGGTIWSVAKVACGEEPKFDAAGPIVAVDGCATGCAARILLARGITPKAHLLVSDLGIGKDETTDFDADELQLVKDGIEASCSEAAVYFPRVAGACCCR